MSMTAMAERAAVNGSAADVLAATPKKLAKINQMRVCIPLFLSARNGVLELIRLGLVFFYKQLVQFALY
jgi:glycogen synthase